MIKLDNQEGGLNETFCHPTMMDPEVSWLIQLLHYSRDSQLLKETFRYGWSKSVPDKHTLFEPNPRDKCIKMLLLQMQSQPKYPTKALFQQKDN